MITLGVIRGSNFLSNFFCYFKEESLGEAQGEKRKTMPFLIEIKVVCF